MERTSAENQIEQAAKPRVQPHMPLLQEVEDALREKIRSGRYKSGQWLPAERLLTQEFKVHRRVVRAAIARLTTEGLILREPNCRPIVQSMNGHKDAGGAVAEPESQFPASRLVALIMWHGGHLDTEGSAQQKIFWGINQELCSVGYHAVFLDLGEKIGTVEDNARQEALHLQYAIDHNFGGVIFYPYAYEKNHELVRKISRRMPLVLLDRMLEGIESDFVGVQNRQAMIDSVAYLVGLGHRRIAYITRNEPINTVQDRLQGYLTAMHATFEDDTYEVVVPAPRKNDAYWPAFDCLFSLPANERPTAALCVNDYEAVRVATRLEALNLKVGRDVSLIGCDNLIQRVTDGIGLTSIAQPFEALGKAAADLYLHRTEIGRSEPLRVELPTTLVVRESCAPPQPD